MATDTGDQTSKVRLKALDDFRAQWRQYETEPIVEAIFVVQSYEDNVDTGQCIDNYLGDVIEVPARSVGVIGPDQLAGSIWPDNVAYIAPDGTPFSPDGSGPEHDAGDDDDDPEPMITDGGRRPTDDADDEPRRLTVQPDRCDECGYPLDRLQNCRNDDCPESDGAARDDAGE